MGIKMAPSARVYAALGTNLGDKLTNLENALAMLSQMVGPVEATSRLYTTAPQYVEDQPAFLNLVARLHTDLKPKELLGAFKTIEREVGRTPSLRWGPRLIDVDILLYDDLTLKTDTEEGPLIVPHEWIAERDFVLAPLCDLAPDLMHPVLNKTIQMLYDTLKAGEQRYVPPVPMLPVHKSEPWALGSKTFIMGIVNVTPDSFSDGAELETVNAAVHKALEMEKAGVDIIDIGGESSRPGAESVTEEEELKRVLPVIRSIREKSKVAISIDTTKAEVARQAVEAGANIVNDISAGLKDSEMLKTVAKLRVPIVLMHMRGTPKTMTQLKEYEDVTTEVSDVLNERVEAAEASGIFRWNIILDPGIGFAKARVLNLQLLRKLSTVKETCHGLPLLVGSSRKGFIGEICGRPEPKDRAWGTAATCCAAIQQGTDILRVHDAAEMVDVVKMSDAIWREE
ncbi:Folic acid synthesis protein fol1 [Phytophthora citrophthora]|uniref:Folic acid synthesis protein fol1 n=1 Tax=Phytophthora citrophthora TaxID=4793 RepID=A0AAD9LBK4_9STRA|nr:Folic acid synthesis protein fol1 [Phytophthora citrophthora]